MIRTKRLVVWMVAGLFVGQACGSERPFVAAKIAVPAGLVVEVAAAPPLVKHPMLAGFDERGRLFVAESAGQNLKAAELEKELPNFIRLLEDTDGDGVFDKSTVFADKMTLPMGALWHRGALYVASPPVIWMLEDTDDDGVADKRTILVDTFGYTGNAASVHGCFLGPQGRIYWCDGRHGHEFRDREGSVSSKGLAARIFSCKPDGSDVRVWCGGGMDNPVEIVFTPTGEMLGSVNILVAKPRGDCVMHWSYGGVYPHHACVSEFQRTGELLPPTVNLGHVAVSGLDRYRGTQLGLQYKDNVFVTEFNTHKVRRIALYPFGSTYAGRVEEFLTCASVDFHPTDVLEDADGSLLVIDTGGWFRIGCPVSQIAKPEILGAIYRIRRPGATVADPRGRSIAWKTADDATLTRLLDDPRCAVRDRAVDELAQRGDAALPAIRSVLRGGSVAARQQAVWAAARIDSQAAREPVRQALADPHGDVRQAAIHAAADFCDPAALPILEQLLLTGTPPLRRAAAMALGRLKDPRGIAPLLAGLRAENDRLLEHALVYALIEIDDPAATARGLADGNPNVRRGALVALDQMHNGQLTKEQVVPLLDTSDAALQKAALEVVSRRPGWAKETVGLLEGWLKEPALLEDRAALIRGTLAAFGNDAGLQSLVGSALGRPETAGAVKLLLLEVIAQSGLEKLPEPWIGPLEACLAAGEPALLLQAVRATGSSMDRFDGRLRELADDASRPAELRLAALRSLAHRRRSISGPAFAFLLAALSDSQNALVRLEAAEVLGRASLDKPQLLQLVDRLGAAGPLEAPGLLEAFGRSTDREVGMRFVAALAQASGLSSLSPARLREVLGAYPAEVAAAAAVVLRRLDSEGEQQQARLAEAAARLTPGSAERGKQVFFGQQASCYACHRIAGNGGLVGPDLSTIGQSRSTLDLLEAILFPNASFARGYEPYTVATKAGEIHAGVIYRETADAVHLVTAQRNEVRILRSAIEDLAPGRVSVMPQGLDQTISRAELADLIAYLKSLK